MEFEFSGQIFESYSILNIMEFHRVETKLFHAGEETGRHDKLCTSKLSHMQLTLLTYSMVQSPS